MPGKLNNPVFIAFLVLVALFSIFTYSHEAAKMAIRGNFCDFGHFYFYSKAMRLGYDIYGMDEATRTALIGQFRMPEFMSEPPGYPPGFFLMFHSLTFLDYPAAARIWLLINNLFLVMSIMIILSLVFEKIRDIDRTFIILSVIFLAFSFQPLLEDMAVGQINAIVLFCLTGCLYLLDRRKWVLSGIALSMGVLIKPQLGILLVFFLWKKCYRVFFPALAFLLILQMLPILSFGQYHARGYSASIINSFDIYAHDVSMANYSLEALFNRLFDLAGHPGTLIFSLSLSLTVSLGLLAFLIRATRGKFERVDDKFFLEFSLAVIFVLIAFPVVHEPHYLFLYLPIIFIWAGLTERPNHPAAIFFVISFLLIGLGYSLRAFPVFCLGPLAVFSGFKLYGVIILFMLTSFLLIRRQSSL